MDQELLDYVNHIVDRINDIAAEGYEAMYDYLSDCLDVEFVCNSRKEFIRAEFAITLGGPSVYVDSNGHVNGYWGGKNYERSIDDEAEEMIYQIAQDWWYN